MDEWGNRPARKLEIHLGGPLATSAAIGSLRCTMGNSAVSTSIGEFHDDERYEDMVRVNAEEQFIPSITFTTDLLSDVRSCLADHSPGTGGSGSFGGRPLRGSGRIADQYRADNA